MRGNIQQNASSMCTEVLLKEKPFLIGKVNAECKEMFLLKLNKVAYNIHKKAYTQEVLERK